jgi:hypothetical protein
MEAYKSLGQGRGGQVIPGRLALSELSLISLKRSPLHLNPPALRNKVVYAQSCVWQVRDAIKKGWPLSHGPSNVGYLIRLKWSVRLKQQSPQLRKIRSSKLQFSLGNHKLLMPPLPRSL